MKIYCVQWNNLPPWVDDFVLFTSAIKAKRYWEKQIKQLKKTKAEEWKNGQFRLYVYTSCNDKDGSMEADLIAWFDKEDEYLYRSEENWKLFLEECKKK